MSSTLKYTLQLLLLFVAAIVVWYFSNIFIYIAIAAILSLLGHPVVKLLSRVKIKNKKLPYSICALGGLLSLLFAFFLIISLFVPLIIEEIRILASIDQEAVLLFFDEPINNIENTLRQFQLNPENHSIEGYLQEKFHTLFNFSILSLMVNSVVSTAGDFLVGFIATLFITFFFLKDKNLINNFILFLTPKEYELVIKNVLADSRKLLSRYFIGLFIEIVIVVIMITSGLSLLGIKNALIIGFISGLLNIIPYIGPLIAGILGLIIGISTNLDLNFYSEIVPLMLKIIMVFSVSQLIDNLLLQPIIFSTIVKAHPLEIFLIILIAGNTAGIGGMILAIPIYTIIRVLVKELNFYFKKDETTDR